MYKFTIFAILATALFCLAAASPKPGSECQPGEAYYPCGMLCEKHCGKERPSSCVHMHTPCEVPAGCRCEDGRERHPITGKCVYAYQCP